MNSAIGPDNFVWPLSSSVVQSNSLGALLGDDRANCIDPFAGSGAVEE